MTSALIGHTGFVGGNQLDLYRFDDLYNSTNFHSMEGKSYDLVVCAGVPASMWLANKYPDRDLSIINELLEVIKTMDAKRFVLISSTAVYAQPVKDVYEDTLRFEEGLAYGCNRRHAEEVIAGAFKDHLIIRLPALFGKGLKKNFIYDLINQEPAFMPEEKFKEIISKLSQEDSELLKRYYIFNDSKNMFAFDKKRAVANTERTKVLDALKRADFTALKFTHSESAYQFYSLSNLWRDINTAFDNGIRVLNICSEPVKAKAVAKTFFEVDFENDNGKAPFDYDMKTRYAHLWGKSGDYQYSKNEVFAELSVFFAKELDR